MKNEIQLKAEQLNKKHRRKHFWYRILSVPACLVVFVTTYAMILPAITLETTPDTYCGLNEHVHGDSCYEKPGVCEHKEMQCSQKVPGEDEYIVHKHDSFCFDNGELICGLPEAEEHTHTEECYETGSLICHKRKSVAHQHTSDCIVTIPAVEPQGLLCLQNEHRHTAECFRQDAQSIAGANISVSAIGGVSVTVTDSVASTGMYTASLTDRNGSLSGRNISYKWYKSVDGGDYTAVEPKHFSIGGKTVSNLSGSGNSHLFLSLDGGGVSTRQTTVKYKAVLCVDETEQSDIYAEIVNTTHQSEVLNGSFEAPDLKDHDFQEFVPEGTEGLYWKTTADNVEADQSVYNGGTSQKGKHYIEIVDTSGSANNRNSHKYAAGTWHGQASASEGKQYAEINAGAAGALYQTIATVPGTVMHWSVDHSGRDGTDTMAVVAMSEELAKTITTQTQLLAVIRNPSAYAGAQVFSGLTASKGTWKTHSGDVTIPDGQYETRFFFVAQATHNDQEYIGNHIDNVWFSTEAPPPAANDATVTISKTVMGDLSQAKLEELRYQLKFLIKDTSGNILKTVTALDLGEWTELDGDNAYMLSRKISISDLVGKTVTVEETDAQIAGYTFTAEAANTSFVRVQNNRDYDFAFTNIYFRDLLNLKIRKIVSAPSTDGTFDIEVSYVTPEGETVTEICSLKNGAEKTVAGIPPGARVTVREPNHDGYTVIMKDGDTLLSGSDLYSFAMTDHAEITVYNTATALLPQTGGIGTGLYIYGGMSMMLLAVVLGYFFRRRYGKEDD